MVETAAHLVGHVFPRIPVRQWVLSFPWPLRLLFAARPDVLTRVLNVVARAVSSAVLKRAGAGGGGVGGSLRCSRIRATLAGSVTNAMRPIALPQLGQANGNTSYDCRDAGGRAMQEQLPRCER